MSIIIAITELLGALSSIGVLLFAVYGIRQWRAQRNRESEHGAALALMQSMADIRETVERNRASVPSVQPSFFDQADEWDRRTSEVRECWIAMRSKASNLALLSGREIAPLVRPVEAELDRWISAAWEARDRLRFLGRGSSREPFEPSTILVNPNGRNAPDPWFSELTAHMQAVRKALKQMGVLL